MLKNWYLGTRSFFDRVFNIDTMDGSIDYIGRVITLKNQVSVTSYAGESAPYLVYLPAGDRYRVILDMHEDFGFGKVILANANGAKYVISRNQFLATSSITQIATQRFYSDEKAVGAMNTKLFMNSYGKYDSYNAQPIVDVNSNMPR